MRWTRSGARLVSVASLLAVLWPTLAGAQGTDAAREAGVHFRRGVELYNEANYEAALVEFRRAYALASSSTALYDIGETQYQLQDYAGALQTFRTFLEEFGPSENHHAEVEANVQILSTRVGRLRVGTIPPGAEIAIDDQPVGKTPLAEPRLVSVGRRKVVASMPGRESVTRYVDVAAGDDAGVTIVLPGPAAVAPLPAEPAVETVTAPRSHVSPDLWTAGWITTGALAATAATFGVLAVRESDVLRQARSGLTTSEILNHDAHLTLVFSGLADSFAVAAIAAGALSLYWTLSSTSTSRGATAPTTRIGFGPASARFEATF